MEPKSRQRDQRLRFSILLPLLALLTSGTLFLIPAYQGYNALVAAPVAGSKIILTTRTTTVEIPRDHAFRMASFMASLKVEGKIVALNMPGHFFQVLIAILMGKNAHWLPESIGPALWRVIAFPIFAAPGWWFVGEGLDNLLRGRKVGKASIIASSVLSIAFATFAALLRFGLTESERNDQEMLGYYMLGLALWSLLLAVPAFSWIRWKTYPAD